MTKATQSHVSRRLKLRDLHILSMVVQWGSMAKAASHLAMSQPGVWEAIANLEAALGVRLLDRSARGAEPTRYAHALLKRTQVIFDELTQGISEIEFMADPTVGEVRIAAGDTIAAGLLPAIIDQLSLRYPKIVIRVLQANAETLDFRELRERSVDLALVRVSGPLEQRDLDAEVLFEDPHRVVVGANSPWARHRKVALAELVDEPWIFPSGQVIREMVAEAFTACGLKVPQERVISSSIVLRNRLLATGRFVTVLPASVVRYNAKQWSLKTLPLTLAVKPRSVAMLLLKNRTASPAVQLFVEHARRIGKTMAAPTSSA